MASQISINLAQQMYVVYYGRPGDPEGLSYWASVFDTTTNLTQALNSFGTSIEFNESFGSLPSNELISNLYQQMYGRAPDSEGLDFYTERLASGAATLASIGKQIADGSQNSDLETLNNRITVANSFTDEIASNEVVFGADDVASAQTLLSAVDDTNSSVTTGISSAIAYVVGLLTNTDNSSSYQVVEQTATYSEAKAHAESLGGHLVIINDADENNLVYDLLVNANITSTAADGGDAIYAWIGASDELSEGTWLWGNGEPVEQANAAWGSGGVEPDDFTHSSVSPTGQDYAAMALSSWPYGSSGEWNDVSGQNQLAYVIEFGTFDML